MEGALQLLLLLQSFLVFLVVSADSFLVSKITALTNTTPGSGMDKPSVSFFGLFSNGGEFSVQLCSGGQCCQTEALNTKDNNWELGQVDMFVGSQIDDCFNFPVVDDLSLTLWHRGSNAGRLDWVRVSPWHQNAYWQCDVGVDLDHSSSHTTECRLVERAR